MACVRFRSRADRFGYRHSLMSPVSSLNCGQLQESMHLMNKQMKNYTGFCSFCLAGLVLAVYGPGDRAARDWDFYRSLVIQSFLPTLPTAESAVHHQHPDYSPVRKPGTHPFHRPGKIQATFSSHLMSEHSRKASGLRRPA